MRTRLDLLSIPQSGGKNVLFLTFSVLVANPKKKKLLYTEANPARGLLLDSAEMTTLQTVQTVQYIFFAFLYCIPILYW